MVDAVVVSNMKSRICGFNEAAERLFEFSREEAIGQDISILMPQPYCNIHQNFVSRYRTTFVILIIFF